MPVKLGRRSNVKGVKTAFELSNLGQHAQSGLGFGSVG